MIRGKKSIINHDQNLESTTSYPSQNHKERLRLQTEGKMQIFQKEILECIKNSAENDQEKV